MENALRRSPQGRHNVNEYSTSCIDIRTNELLISAMSGVSRGMSRGETQAGSSAGRHVGGQDVVGVAVEVAAGPVVPHRGARVSVPSGDRSRLAFTGCGLSWLPRRGWSGLQLAVMPGLLVAVTASPRRAVPGWPRWPGLPGVCLAGQSGSGPVIRRPAGSHDAVAAGLAPEGQRRSARRRRPGRLARTALDPWPGSRARLVSFTGRAGRVT